MKLKEARSSSFITQAIILAIAGLISRFLGFLYRIPLTAMLGNTGIGIYSAGYNFYTLLLIMSSAGLPAAISKMVSERVAQNRYEDAHNVFRVALTVAYVTGIVSSVILFFGAETLSELVRKPESKYSIITLSPTLLVVAVMAVYRGYFQGLNTTVPTALSQVIEQVFNAFFTVFLTYIFLGKGLAYASAGGTAATGIGALAGLVTIILCYLSVKKELYRRIKKYPQNAKNKEARRKLCAILIKTAVPVIIGTAIFSITNLADTGMVTALLMSSGFSKAATDDLFGQLTGKYVVLTTLPVSFATAFATAAVPNIAAAMQDKNPGNVKRKVDMALRTTMLIAFPCAVGIGVLGEQILKLLWPTVHGGGILLQTGAVAIVFLSLAQICTGALQGINKVHIPAISAGFGAIAKIALNLVLIPITSINVVGAVISTIACYLVAGLINFYFLVKYSEIRPDYMSIFIKPFIASAIMGVGAYCAYYIPLMFGMGQSVSTVFSILFSVFLYFTFMLYLGGIKRDDILLLPLGNKALAALERLGFM